MLPCRCWFQLSIYRLLCGVSEFVNFQYKWYQFFMQIPLRPRIWIMLFVQSIWADCSITYKYIGEGVPLSSQRISPAPTRHFRLGMSVNVYRQKSDNCSGSSVSCHNFSGDVHFNQISSFMWIKMTSSHLKTIYKSIKNEQSVRHLWIIYENNWCFMSCYSQDTWAPSQYKDRLIYVWRFPC